MEQLWKCCLFTWGWGCFSDLWWSNFDAAKPWCRLSVVWCSTGISRRLFQAVLEINFNKLLYWALIQCESEKEIAGVNHHHQQEFACLESCRRGKGLIVYLFKLLSRPRQAEINLMQESECGVGGREGNLKLIWRKMCRQKGKGEGAKPRRKVNQF